MLRNIVMSKSTFKKLEDLKARKSDLLLNEAVLSKSFSKAELPENVRYVFESMRKIDTEYTLKTYDEAKRVENQIRNGVEASVSFEYQGSVPLDIHIRIHSDLDILTINEDFVSLEPPQKASNPYTGDPVAELRNLRKSINSKLSSSFPNANVDNSKAKAIAISGGSLQRKFDIIICNWYKTVSDEKAIKIYDKENDLRVEDYTFTHMAVVNQKANQVFNDNYRRIIRLLKNLKADADEKINLSSFLITSIMFHMSDLDFYVEYRNSTKLLVNASKHLAKVIENRPYRMTLDSPNGREKLFFDDEQGKIQEVKKLKKELDETIELLAIEIKQNSGNLNESYRMFSVGNSFETLEKADFNY